MGEGNSAAFKRRNGFSPIEIEPGRAVPNNWDKALRETWAERKARLAAKRAEQP